MKAPWLAASAVLLACCALFLSCSPPAPADGFTVALVDLAGHARVLGTLPRSVFAPRVSPDGRQLAFELEETPVAGEQSPLRERLWIAPLERLDHRRALPLVGKRRDWAPMWTRDGARLAFLASGDDGDILYWRRADGSGEAERLVEGRSAEDTTTDGRQLSFLTIAGDRDYDISLLDLASRSVTVLVDRRGSGQHSSNVSPGGGWIAYASNETGLYEIWLEPLPPTGERHQVTHGGGSHPVWSADGTTIYFDRAAQLFSVDFHLDTQGPQFGAPVALPIAGFQQGQLRRQFDLMPDGRHFLLLFPPGALP